MFEAGIISLPALRAKIVSPVVTDRTRTATYDRSRMGASKMRVSCCESAL
jgi:hypothetical protein